MKAVWRGTELSETVRVAVTKYELECEWEGLDETERRERRRGKGGSAFGARSSYRRKSGGMGGTEWACRVIRGSWETDADRMGSESERTRRTRKRQGDLREVVVQQRGVGIAGARGATTGSRGERRMALDGDCGSSSLESKQAGNLRSRRGSSSVRAVCYVSSSSGGANARGWESTGKSGVARHGGETSHCTCRLGGCDAREAGNMTDDDERRGSGKHDGRRWEADNKGDDRRQREAGERGLDDALRCVRCGDDRGMGARSRVLAGSCTVCENVSETGTGKSMYFGDMVAEMTTGRSDDGGDVAESEELMTVFLVDAKRALDARRWNRGLEEGEQAWTRTRTRRKRDEMGAERKRALSDDRRDREVGLWVRRERKQVGVEEARDKARATVKLRRDDGAWEARRQDASLMFAYGRSGGVSSDAVVDLEGATGSDAGFTRVTATSTVGSLKCVDGAAGLDTGSGRTSQASDLGDAGVADRSAGHRKLLSHLREPLLVVDVRDEVAVRRARWTRWSGRETVTAVAGAEQTPPSPPREPGQLRGAQTERVP
ncbi:hypothetical protein V8D89_008653 [Ganoderma adspersum]